MDAPLACAGTGWARSPSLADASDTQAQMGLPGQMKSLLRSQRREAAPQNGGNAKVTKR